MNKPQYHIDEALVQRYRAGKLSEEEQRWLEENPFEAEALQGLAGTNGWSEDIPALQQQLRERTSKRTTLWLTYGRYAAATAVLLTVGWFAYQTVSTGNIGDKAVNEEIASQPLTYQAQSDSVVEETAPLAAMAPERIANQQATEAVGSQVPDLPSNEVKPVLIPERESIAVLEPAAAPSFSEAADMADEELPKTSRDAARGVEAEMSIAQNARMQAKQSRYPVPTEQFAHQVSGAVYSADDHAPLPGVNVIVKGTLVGTITDMNGQFQVAVPDSSSKELEFSFIGFHPEKVSIGQQDSLVIQLEQDEQALSEVVVTGRYRRSDRASSAAHPIPTYDSFRNYLQTNLRYPAVAREQKVEGTVRVQFTVDTEGNPTDFTIKKSLGYGCDEESIRLIKEGPNWQPATRNGDFEPGQVTVKVRFKLPTK
ncbi:MAG: TonB family protein [Cyclobacteriaceae bacterium]